MRLLRANYFKGLLEKFSTLSRVLDESVKSLKAIISHKERKKSLLLEQEFTHSTRAGRVSMTPMNRNLILNSNPAAS